MSYNARMNAHYSIRIDPERDLVHIELAGLFGEEDIPTYRNERRAAHAQLRCGANAHFTLVDLRELKIQPQESVAAFQAILANPEFRSRRIAFVVAPTLTRSQLLRALAGRGTCCFETVAEAEAWLLEDRAPTYFRAAG